MPMAGFGSFFVKSLALRWVVYILGAAGLGVGLLLVITYAEMDYQVDAQGAAVRQLARKQTVERVESEIELAAQKVYALFDGYEKSLLAVAGLRSTQAAIAHGNDVTIAEEIGQRIVRLGMSGAIVVDAKRNVIGTERTGAELLAANSALKIHAMFPMLGRLLESNDRSQPSTYRYIGNLDASFSAVLLASIQNEFGAVFAVPVFDDFGEPIGLIIAYRLIRLAEPVLADFARVTRSIVVLMSGETAISAGGAKVDQIGFLPGEVEGLRPIPELKASGRCRTAFPRLQLCVIRPDAEIDRISEEIMAIGRSQFRQTQKTLTAVGSLSLLFIMGLLIGLARRLTRPLTEITAAVDGVAKGEWRVEVRHTGRKDEIGQIARAVSAMQVSLLERDRMRQELVRIDAINQRRLVLDNAVARFEDGMAVVMKNINDTVYALGETNTALDEAARAADIQAERIRNTSVVTATETSHVGRTTLELSRTNREIGERVRNTGQVVHQSESHARVAEARLAEVGGLAGEVETAMNSLQGCVADLGAMSLKLSLDALSVSEKTHSFAPFAGKIEALSAKTNEVAAVLAHEIARMVEIAGQANDEIGEVKGVLGLALRETSEISVAVEEQDAAAREIAAGLAKSSGALMGLAEAVDQLRGSMSSAHEASNEFVLAARRMVDDAKSIDGSVRSFVREVNA